jgi:hypothetical protein
MPTQEIHEIAVPHAQELSHRYASVWNEPDAERRRQLIGELWAEDGVQLLQPPEAVVATASALGVTPTFEVRGHAALENRVTRAYEDFVAPGKHVFRTRPDAVALAGVVKFHWDMVSLADGEPVGGGLELLVLDGDGRIRTDYQFIG